MRPSVLRLRSCSGAGGWRPVSAPRRLGLIGTYQLQLAIAVPAPRLRCRRRRRCRSPAEARRSPRAVGTSGSRPASCRSTNSRPGRSLGHMLGRSGGRGHRPRHGLRGRLHAGRRHPDEQPAASSRRRSPSTCTCVTGATCRRGSSGAIRGRSGRHQGRRDGSRRQGSPTPTRRGRVGRRHRVAVRADTRSPLACSPPGGARHRNERHEDYLQTDASINPGNPAARQATSRATCSASIR